MTLTGYFLRTALRNLRRGGQRALVALLCVVFGVMSLVAMQLLARSLATGQVDEPSHQVGADLSLNRGDEILLPEHAAGLQALQASGAIRRFTMVAVTPGLAFHAPASGETHFASFGLGIDPQAYPLAGSFSLAEPAGASLESLLRSAEDVLITLDLARAYGFEVGERIVLADLQAGAPLEGRIRGLLADTPNHEGSKVYYTLAAAERLVGGRPAANLALANADDPLAAERRLAALGWNVQRAGQLADHSRPISELIDLCLKGAGLLGLLVGGIGIANTMQVLLQRRRREVAVLKTLGYRQGELQALFAIEAALLGAAGSLPGAALGAAVSYALVEAFRRTGNVLYDWVFSPLTLGMGVLAGLLTTVVFASWTIVKSSRVQPTALLRNEATQAAHLPWLQGLGLLLLLGLPFTAIASLAMGSILEGVGVLLFALTGLVVLGGLLGGLAWAAPRLLPLGGLPLARLARANLRRRGLALVFAMIALFAGVVSMALGVVIVHNGQREIEEHAITVEGYNLNVFAPASQEQAARQALAAQELQAFSSGCVTSVRSIRAPGARGSIPPYLVGRDDPHEYQLQGAPWGSRPEGAYAAIEERVPIGSQVQVTLWDGSQHSLEVVGTYQALRSNTRLPPQPGLLVPAGLGRRLAPPDTIVLFARLEEGRVAEASRELGKALPQAAVIDLVAYASRYLQAYRDLFTVAAAMSALALLAGTLLVANSVSLAMLDRRYEIGVLKVVGYSPGQVLAALALEYGLAASIAVAIALLAVRVFLWALAAVNELAGALLFMPLPLAALIGLSAVGLVLLTVVSVSWGPSRVPPVVILNDRG